jgi:phage terminase large subunit GpA-like protein
MINKDIQEELLVTYRSAFQRPYNKGFLKWCEENIELPTAYSIPGRLEITETSPYLIAPMRDFDNPKIEQINLIASTQCGKSLVKELAIPYVIINNPGPVFNIFHSKDVSDVFMETRIIPLLKNCKVMKPLLEYNKFSTKKSGINLAHMSVTCGGSGTALQHGMSVRFLFLDEVHQFGLGEFDKFKARTTAFSKRRKIIVASQPNGKDSELERIYLSGLVYEWQWCCPHCKQVQPFNWSKQRKDETFCGFNWDTILNEDGETTNIAQSAKTTWLECEECRGKVYDTPAERRRLNDAGQYVLIKNDGDPSIVSYTWPNFVNINLSFESAAVQYMLAKRFKKTTGLDEPMKIFVNQVLGKFYKAEPMLDMQALLCEPYDVNDTNNQDWVRTMGVDVQRSGGVKYWVIFAWHKNGNESRRIDFGIARTWDELEEIRIKNKVPLQCLGIDSGDGENTQNIYQECIKRGKVIQQGRNLGYVCWQPMKGDQKISYKHKDGVTRLYSEISPQDACFPIGSKFKGIPAPLLLWATTSVKIILANLRDNKLPGIKWKLDRPDADFDTQLRSEGLREVVDKRTGATVNRWVEIGHDNHYLDACAMALTIAMQAGVMSSTFTSDTELRKLASIITDQESNK